MNPLLQNRFTYQEIGPELEVNTLPSLTQPDEIMSIREMLTRHTRGLPLSGASREPIYYPEEMGFVPDVASLDLSELHDLAQSMGDRRKILESEISKREAEEKQKKAEKAKKAKEMEDFFDLQRQQKAEKKDLPKDPE